MDMNEKKTRKKIIFCSVDGFSHIYCIEKVYIFLGKILNQKMNGEKNLMKNYMIFRLQKKVTNFEKLFTNKFKKASIKQSILKYRTHNMFVVSVKIMRYFTAVVFMYTTKFVQNISLYADKLLGM